MTASIVHCDAYPLTPPLSHDGHDGTATPPAAAVAAPAASALFTKRYACSSPPSLPTSSTSLSRLIWAPAEATLCTNADTPSNVNPRLIPARERAVRAARKACPARSTGLHHAPMYSEPMSWSMAWSNSGVTTGAASATRGTIAASDRISHCMTNGAKNRIVHLITVAGVPRF